MKKLILIIFLLFFPSILESKVFFGENIKIESIKEDIFALGEKIEAKGNLENEFIGIGRNILSDISLNGDYIGIGLNQKLKCESKSDVYMLGNNVETTGNIKGSISIFGSIISLKGNIEKNLRLFGEKIFLDTNVDGNTVIWGQNIYLKGNFGNLVIHSDEINFNEMSVINGNLVYYSKKEMDFKNVKIKGEKIWKKPMSETIKEKMPILKLKSFYNFLSLLFPFFFMLWFTPNVLSQTAIYSGKKFLYCFGLGIILILITLIIVPIIFVTIIGIPFGLIVSSIFISCVYVSRVFPLIFVGRKILFKLPDKRITWFFSTFIGVLFFTLISIIPNLKLLLNLITIPVGFGAIVLGRVDQFKKLKKANFL